MKLKILTAVSTLNPTEPFAAKGLPALEQSLKHFGYDYKIIHDSRVNWGWGGWECAYEWCKSEEAKDYTHIIFTDGFDTLALAPPEEAMQKLQHLLKDRPDGFIYSVEKHWFPHETGWELYFNQYNDKIKDLPENYRWRYVNGGQWAGTKEAIISWYENAPKDRNNQAWGNAYYATQNDGRLILDFGCELFQTISHSGAAHGSPEEFSSINMPHLVTVGELGTELMEDPFNPPVEVDLKKRLSNNLTKSLPCFIHANGIKNLDESKWMYEILGL